MTSRSILAIPLVCIALLTGCTVSNTKESKDTNITKIEAIDTVEGYIRENKMYHPDYNQVVILDTKDNVYLVEAYYMMYDDAGFLDKYCIGTFKVDASNGEVNGSTNKPLQESVYRGIDQGIEIRTECY